jgi:hypothetical protein
MKLNIRIIKEESVFLMSVYARKLPVCQVNLEVLSIAFGISYALVPHTTEKYGLGQISGGKWWCFLIKHEMPVMPSMRRKHSWGRIFKD